MILSLKNFGIIETAEIELKGLTVLAGLNDTGKSFISKIFYALIKTIKDSSSQDFNRKSMQLDAKWISIRNLLNSIRNPEIAALFEKNIMPLRGIVLNDISNKIPDENIILKINATKSEIINSSVIAPLIKQQLEDQFRSIIDLVSVQRKEEDKYIGYFNQIVIQQLFRSQINCLDNKNEQLEIIWKEGDSQILRLTVNDNSVSSFEINSTPPNLFYFHDATIIDSPIIAQFSNLILKSRLDFNRGQDFTIPIYYSDLVSKFLPIGNPFASDIGKNIQEKIIDGKVVFDEKASKIVYQKNNGQQIENYNIATGIKVFGLIQLLLNSGTINKDSILIIDEPEVHLHPAWQVKFAEIIVALCKEGIPILISSHSPYLLRTIPNFAKKYEIEGITKFYFAEKQLGKTTTSFRDVTEDLDPIFKAFVDPFQNSFLNS